MNMRPQRSQRGGARLPTLALRSLRTLRFHFSIARASRLAPCARLRHGCPRALTLIELLVVIVILVTLVAGVIPILSPNNDVRKIRVAARGLQAYINATLAEAARTGRPRGIGFRETASGSGMALEVFRLEVPAPFAGFSSASRVLVKPAVGNYAGSIVRYINYPLYQLNFEQAGGVTDPLPPGMFKKFDTIEVSGNRFLIVDTQNNTDPANKKWFEYRGDGDGVEEAGEAWYFGDPSGNPANQVSDLECIWLNDRGQQLPPETSKQPYRIIRQPTNSAAAPFVLPAGVGIDMQGSGQEGGTTTGFPIPNSFATDRKTAPPDEQLIPDTVGIMFSPEGYVSSVRHNDREISSVSRVMLLLGRVENGDVQYEVNGGGAVKPGTGTWEMSVGDTDEQLKQKQSEINWLNLDSRWLTIATNSGRAVVSENAFVDPRNPVQIGATPEESAKLQIKAAREFVTQSGGGR